MPTGPRTPVSRRDFKLAPGVTLSVVLTGSFMDVSSEARAWLLRLAETLDDAPVLPPRSVIDR